MSPSLSFLSPSVIKMKHLVCATNFTYKTIWFQSFDVILSILGDAAYRKLEFIYFAPCRAGYSRRKVPDRGSTIHVRMRADRCNLLCRELRFLSTLIYGAFSFILKSGLSTHDHAKSFICRPTRSITTDLRLHSVMCLCGWGEGWGNVYWHVVVFYKLVEMITNFI